MAEANMNTETNQTRSQEPQAPASIGTATQEADGTIVLALRAQDAGGAFGDAQIRYAPGDPDYAMVKAHVGPIPKNGSVPVKPFPDR